MVVYKIRSVRILEHKDALAAALYLQRGITDEKLLVNGVKRHGRISGPRVAIVRIDDARGSFASRESAARAMC